MRRIVAFIPARFASSRLPGKPLEKIAGKMLIQHVYERVAAAHNLDAAYIATDSEDIAAAARGFGAEVIMTPENVTCGTDRIARAADVVGLADDDIVVNVQGDQPLVATESIEAVVSPFLAADYDGSFEMTTLSYRIRNREEITSPKDVKVVCDAQGYALYFSRATIPWGRDDFEHGEHFKHLGVYAYTKRFVDTFAHLPVGRLERLEMLEQLRALEFGYRIKVVETDHDSPEVDEPEDLRRIEVLLTGGA
ncbi:3-deoxy-manno-octulosonate cytidylyltransferase [Sulfurivirga sp.]|uniref:3-deoxy-manno-octulosonate cytidylyltransferase n=1 Tax=Sulfurivirga sp. TaxID=2614236 RepID=UPI0025F0C580|nr:3-deoxy-manno-octulosonate cytidylyltransferase [Sulfurivirga sp.]